MLRSSPTKTSTCHPPTTKLLDTSSSPPPSSTRTLVATSEQANTTSMLPPEFEAHPRPTTNFTPHHRAPAANPHTPRRHTARAARHQHTAAAEASHRRLPTAEVPNITHLMSTIGRTRTRSAVVHLPSARPQPTSAAALRSTRTDAQPPRSRTPTDDRRCGGQRARRAAAHRLAATGHVRQPPTSDRRPHQHHSTPAAQVDTHPLPTTELPHTTRRAPCRGRSAPSRPTDRPTCSSPPRTCRRGPSLSPTDRPTDRRAAVHHHATARHPPTADGRGAAHHHAAASRRSSPTTVDRRAAQHHLAAHIHIGNGAPARQVRSPLVT
jgi:hypothetical protein